MKRLRKFLCKPHADRKRLIQIAGWVGAVRLGLLILPFRTVQWLLSRMAHPGAFRRHHPPVDTVEMGRIVQAVSTAGRYLAANCLPQALATHAILSRRGVPVLLRIGAARNTVGAFSAHAWVEHDGKVLIGQLEDLQRYVPLLPSGERLPLGRPARNR